MAEKLQVRQKSYLKGCREFMVIVLVAIIYLYIIGEEDTFCVIVEFTNLVDLLMINFEI